MGERRFNAKEPYSDFHLARQEPRGLELRNNSGGWKKRHIQEGI